MRLFGLVLSALLVPVLLFAQAPAPPGPPAKGPSKLDEYPGRWQAEMKKIKTLGASLARLDKDKTFDTVTKLEGAAYYMKAGTEGNPFNLALMELRKAGKPDIAEKYVCSGTFLY